MAVYLVEGATGKTLVETRNASVALSHVAKKTLTVKSVNTSELVKLLKEGLQVETITPEEPKAESTSAE